MLKIGIIGAGSIAERFHLPAWQKIDNAEVVAICDINEKAARNLAQLYSIEEYTSFSKMLNRENLDILDICTPNALHAEHILQALDHNLHVVVEKPFVTRSKDAKIIIEKAITKNKKVMCAQHQRFRPQTSVARKIIIEGELGEIYYARAQAIQCRNVPTQNNSFTDKTLAGGGPLMDLGAHIIDVTWWLMGCPKPVSTLGHVFTKLAHQPNITNALGKWEKYNVEDFVCGQIKFENGAVMSLEVSYLLNSVKRVFSTELMGTKGGLLWPDLVLTTDKDGVLKRNQLEIHDDTLASVAELKHFVEFILDNKPPLIPLEESCMVVTMVEALYQSGLENRLVTLN